MYPDYFPGYLEKGLFGNALKENIWSLETVNIRDYAEDKHKTVDDTPYGGGAGMVMKVEPFDKAVEVVKGTENTRVILTSASGKTFTQEDAKRLAQYDQLIFLCGRYEGVDHRVQDQIADETLSIGDYVLTGGELAAMAMTDAVARLVPGVIDKESLARESHDEKGYKEHPQYTRPEDYNGWVVPEVLLSGDHAKIEKWRQDNSK